MDPIGASAAPRSGAAAQGASRPRRKATPAQEPEKVRKAPKKSGPRLNPVLEFFRAPRTRYILGILLVVWAVVALIVTFSYLKNGAADQSLIASQTIAQAADSGQKIHNPGGAAGAALAHLMLIDGFGVASFVLIFYVGTIGLALFGLVRVRFWSFTFKCLFTTVALSIILALCTFNIPSTVHWGGNHGRYVNLWLYHVSDWLGAYAVTVILAALLAVVYIAQITKFVNNVSGRVAKARAAMASAAEQGRRRPTDLADIPAETAAEPNAAEPAAETPVSKAAAVVAETPVVAAQDALIGFSIDDAEPDAEYQPEEASNSSEISENSENFEPSEPSEPSEPEFTINGGNLEDNTAGDESEPVPTVPFNIRDELSHYRFPGLDLLEERPVLKEVDPQEQEDNKNMIVNTLRDYGVPIAKIEATVGPTVTLYEVVPAEGVRIAQIKRLEDDIALSLAALGIRIIAPMPGKGTVGIEVPNRDPQTVSMFTVINSRKFRECKMALPMALGATINNDIFIEDLARMPHLLVAGATGQGKSVGLNCIIASLLYKKHPGELKFVLIDPKMVEFSLYSRIEHHYLAKLPDEEEAIVTEPSKALATLQSLCLEMDLRYDLLKAASVRTVEEYNRKFSQRRLNPEKGHRYMPYIVVVVDEFADLIMTAGKDISLHIARIAQKARAVGMHMIIATQRPSTDIITGMIKANFPGRIAFRVASMVDSKTILDRPGANRLIGRGDLLFSHNSKMERVQCAFIDTPEVEAIVDFIDRQTGYPTAYLLPEPQSDNALTPGAIDLSRRDELFDDCARFVVQNSTASTSSLQRRFGIGYNKAGKIMDQLEAAGIVGPADGQRPRQVLVDSMAVEDLIRAL